MSYRGEHRLEHQHDRSGTRKSTLLYGTAAGVVAVNIALGMHHPVDIEPLRNAATRYRDAQAAKEMDKPLSPADVLRQHRVSLLVGSIVETLRDRTVACETPVDKPTCYFTTNAYEEPTSAWVTYTSPETKWSTDERSVHALRLQNIDCTIEVTKNAHGVYRTTLRDYDTTRQTVEFNPADTPYTSDPVRDNDIQCLANIDQLLKALPPLSSGDEVPTTIDV